MSGTAPTRIRLSAAQRRERVLAAATSEFAAQGYDGASLRAIARCAGVTTPVVYEHFGSKASLFTAVIQAQADALLVHWAEPPVGSPEQVFDATMDGIFGWIEEHPDGWRILFTEAPADPVVRATFVAIQDRATASLASIFASLPTLERPAMLDRGRAELAYAEAAKSAVNGLAAWWWHNRDVPRAATVALASELLWRGLREMTTPEQEKPA